MVFLPKFLFLIKLHLKLHSCFATINICIGFDQEPLKGKSWQWQCGVSFSGKKVELYLKSV